MKASKYHKPRESVQYNPKTDNQGTCQTTTGKFCCVPYVLKIIMTGKYYKMACVCGVVSGTPTLCSLAFCLPRIILGSDCSRFVLDILQPV